jgi:hypothetical protein
MRQRISWDEKRVAAIEKKADPYTLNQTRMNPPADKYRTGDPSTWAEDVDMKNKWKNEGRTETGHPAPADEASAMAPATPAAPAAPAPEAQAPEESAQQAVMAARKLEAKALNCITIAQRMLPGADDDMVEKQATELMYLPEKCVLSTLQRQVALATKLAGEEAEEAAENETAEKQKAEDAEDKKAEDEKKPEEEEKKPEEPVTAKKEKEEEKPVDPAAPVAPAAPAPEAEVNLSASDNDLLDALFADETPKTGAKKLSGIVKQASSGGMSLDNLWALPPDVSSTFK